MEVDPDYAGFVVNEEDNQQEERSRILHENARDATVDKIRSIIDDQFNREIEMKENELMTINQKLADARSVMDRLRACVVASFYAASFTKPMDGAKGPAQGAAYHPAIQNVMRKAVTSVLSKKSPPSPVLDQSSEDQNIKKINNAESCDISVNEAVGSTNETNTTSSQVENQIQKEEKTQSRETGKSTENLGGRQRIKKTIVIGNVSKYIPPEQREVSDKSTHKWMVYVRGDKNEPRIDHFVRKVWFFLHPSYRPNDLVEVCEAPFHLTRRGWGEFPIRVQIHFCDRRNRPVDIIHGLRLDRSYTGLQTLGAETVCEVELDKSSFQLNVDEILSVSNLPELPVVNTNTDPEELVGDGGEKSCEFVDSSKPIKTTEINVERESKIDINESKENDNHDLLQPCAVSLQSTPSRKRLLSEDQSTEDQKASDQNESDSKNESMANADLVDKDDVSEEIDEIPLKKRRKRRRDNSIRTSQSEDEMLSDTNETSNKQDNTVDEVANVSSEGNQTPMELEKSIDDAKSANIIPQDPIASKQEKTLNSSRETASDTNRSSSSDSLFESVTVPTQKAATSTQSEDETSLIKQPIVILPRSPISSSGFFRVRSVSDGAEMQTTKMLQPTNIPSVLDSKKTLEQSSDTKMQPSEILAGGCDSNISEKGTKSADSVSSKPQEQTKIVKKDVIKRTHFTVSLSSLLKAAGTSQKPLKISRSLLKGGALPVNTQAIRREKRSFSADHPTARTLTLAAPGSGQAPLQLRIISPPHALKKVPQSKKSNVTLPRTPVNLQTLKAVLSPGTSLTGKPTGTSGQQFILTTVVNTKGKQQLTLIKPSSLSTENAKKIITFPVSKATDTKPLSTDTKPQLPQLAPLPKQVKIPPKTKELVSQPKLKEPIHMVIGDRVDIKRVNSIVDDILPHVAKLVPLVSDKREVADFPFAAKTESDFLDWNIGKQRASEWQRASLIHRVLKYVQNKHEELQNVEIPSKKFIMSWCLRHGYSVFTDEYEEESEAVEDSSKIASEYDNNSIPSTRTTCAEMLKLLESKKEEKKEKKLEDDDVVFVDVVTVENPDKKPISIKEEPCAQNEMFNDEEISNELAAKVQLLQNSVEVKAVADIAREIGANLRSSSENSLCHVVLAKAMQQFVETLLRKSMCASLVRRDGKALQRVVPDEIKVVDVVAAVNNSTALDFITDSSTGSEI